MRRIKPRWLSFIVKKGELVRIDANLSTEEVYEQVLKNI